MSMFLVWLANLVFIVPLIILIMAMVVLARALYYRACAEYKYQELDDNDEPLVDLGQGDYRKVTRPSDISTDPEVIERNMALYDDDDVEYCSDPSCPTCGGHGAYIDSDGVPDACLTFDDSGITNDPLEGLR